MTENEKNINTTTMENTKKEINKKTGLTKEPKIEIIKTTNNHSSIIKYFLYFVTVVFIALFSIYYTHIYAVKNIVKKINKNKETVIYYNNQTEQKNIIPEIINYTKSWIINDKRVVQLIIDIMGIYVTDTTDINKQYKNQIVSVVKANELLKLINLHPILKTDETYLNQRKKFKDLYDKNMTAFTVCKKLSSKLLQLKNTTIYKKYGNQNINFDEIICTD